MNKYRLSVKDVDTIRLQRAIERSQEQNRTVRCQFRGSETDLRVALHVIHDGEFDTSPENDGTIDAWGYTDPIESENHDWRISVTLEGNQ